ncbi:MAG: sigma-70 family RNA polymerase sigma factor [Bryobacteraceae bacterium]
MQKVLPEVANNLEMDLVTRAQQGDRSAFALLVQQNQSSCRRLAQSILRDSHAAEDEVQTAYTKALQHIGKFQRESKFSTWLNRIVANQCLMRLRNLRRSRFFHLDEEPGDDGAIRELPTPGPNPEAEFARREMAQILAYEVRHIPPLMRDVVVLRDVHELPMEEVARRLGISVSAAKSRLLRARAELRQRLERHHGRMGLSALTA